MNVSPGSPRPIVLDFEAARSAAEGRMRFLHLPLAFQGSAVPPGLDRNGCYEAVCGHARIRLRPGLRFWVRETLVRHHTFGAPNPTAKYEADLTGVAGGPATPARTPDGRAIWLSSKDALPAPRMPRWASRFILGIEEMAAMRLEDVDDFDAGLGARESFPTLWERRHNPRGLAPSHRAVCAAANPWIVQARVSVRLANVDAGFAKAA